MCFLSLFLAFCIAIYMSFRLFETLQSLFWSIFGLLNLYVTNVKARHEFTEFVGATMFGTYNVISLVVLLNMLIAMMNNSYQLIAVSPDHKNSKSQKYTVFYTDFINFACTHCKQVPIVQTLRRQYSTS